MDENNILVKAVKNGDELAFEELLNRHHKMIYKIIYSLNIDQGDYKLDIDNLYQEGSIALYEATFSFEEGKGAVFSSYAYMIIRSKIMSYYHRHCNYHKHERYSIDVDNGEYHLSMSSLRVSEDPVQYHKEQEFAKYLNNFIKRLPSIDKQILKLRNEDYSYKEISNKLNIPTKKVDNELRLMKKRLRRYLGKDETKKTG